MWSNVGGKGLKQIAWKYLFFENIDACYSHRNTYKGTLYTCKVWCII